MPTTRHNLEMPLLYGVRCYSKVNDYPQYGLLARENVIFSFPPIGANIDSRSICDSTSIDLYPHIGIGCRRVEALCLLSTRWI